MGATAPTVIYTLSLHDALPICHVGERQQHRARIVHGADDGGVSRSEEHTSELQSVSISYAVFCLKKKAIGNSPRDVDVHSRHDEPQDRVPRQFRPRPMALSSQS